MRENLEKTNQGEGVRALTRLRCGNMEEWNKYWLEKGERRCSFCSKDNFKHYIEGCREIKDWFSVLRTRKEEVWKKIWSEDARDARKGEVLVRIWKAKEKIKKSKRVRRCYSSGPPNPGEARPIYTPLNGNPLK